MDYESAPLTNRSSEHESLDLIMETSRMDSYNLLEKLAHDPRFSKKPVVVCSKLISSTEAGQEVKDRVLRAGAKAAFPKIDRFPTYEEIVANSCQNLLERPK